MLKRGVYRQILKTSSNLRLIKKQNKYANGVDSDEMAHMSHLIWINTVFSDLFSGK